VLDSQGFDSSSRTVWLIEGLLYIEASEVDRLFARVDALSAPGSVLLYDVVGIALLGAPFLRSPGVHAKAMGALGFRHRDTGCPRRAPRLDRDGHRHGRTGNRWKRWAHPVIPAEVPNAPRGYFIEAIKA
jgi:O-methyltransferase involved in polyketide biosynthesis